MDQLLPPGKPGKDEANISLGKGQQALSFIEGKEGIVVMCTIATLLLLGKYTQYATVNRWPHVNKHCS